MVTWLYRFCYERKMREAFSLSFLFLLCAVTSGCVASRNTQKNIESNIALTAELVKATGAIEIAMMNLTDVDIYIESSELRVILFSQGVKCQEISIPVTANTVGMQPFFLLEPRRSNPAWNIMEFQANSLDADSAEVSFKFRDGRTFTETVKLGGGTGRGKEDTPP